MSTNVPAPTFTPTGFVAPTEAAILAGVQADIQAAFSTTVLNFDPTTPQGQLAASEAAIIGSRNDDFLFYTNQVDPSYAQGRMQDGIARIYFLTREPAEPTVASVACSGLTGVPIPVGAQIIAADGNKYVCTEAGTIPASGSVTLSFACMVTGAIPCPAQTFDIFTTIAGWDSAVSSASGALGNAVESRSEFETRRAASVALNSIGSVQAVKAAVLAVPGVLDAYVIDNPLATTATVGGVALAPHSLYVAAFGGAAADIAQAIWVKKMPGCGMNGNTTITVFDTTYTAPQPSYPITFEVPTPTDVKFAVSIANSAAVPSDAATQVQNAIISAFAGGDGGPRAQIGSTLYASRFYAPIAALGAWAQIVQIQIGTTTANANSVTLNINLQPVVSASDITLTLV
jgi:hypothetical protein